MLSEYLKAINDINSEIGRFGKNNADLNPETEKGNLISFVSKFSALFAYTPVEGVSILFSKAGLYRMD